MNYYEQTRDAIEHLAQCTTSDAQSLIEAWELTNGGTMMEQVNMDKAEEAGTQPEDLARTILELPTTTEALAREFSRVIRTWIPEAHMQAVEQESDPDDATCPTGDYCDSNMAMDEAFTTVTGRDMDAASDEDADLWNAAWKLAKTHKFYPPTQA